MNRKEKGTLTAAFTGGGGKTSLIFYLVEKFSRQGKRVIGTTLQAYRTIWICDRGET